MTHYPDAGSFALMLTRGFCYIGEYTLALHYMYYNFARVHRTLGVTSAMAAGVADHVWTLEEIVRLRTK